VGAAGVRVSIGVWMIRIMEVRVMMGPMRSTSTEVETWLVESVRAIVWWIVGMRTASM
jgi:hypothetical protein